MDLLPNENLITQMHEEAVMQHIENMIPEIILIVND